MKQKKLISKQDCESSDAGHQLAQWLGMGVGLYEKCSKCGTGFVRVYHLPDGSGDFEYEEVKKEEVCK